MSPRSSWLLTAGTSNCRSVTCRALMSAMLCTWPWHSPSSSPISGFVMVSFVSCLLRLSFCDQVLRGRLHGQISSQSNAHVAQQSREHRLLHGLIPTGQDRHGAQRSHIVHWMLSGSSRTGPAFDQGHRVFLDSLKFGSMPTSGQC